MSLNLLKNLNFAEKLNASEAVTEAGKEMLRNYRGYMYSNSASCGVVNGFIQEARNFSFDTGLVSILESVLDYVNKNQVSWQLASACESINNDPSTYNYIAKVGVEQVEKLLEMNESEVVSYIKAGALKNVMYIPQIREACKQVYKSTINEHIGNTYTVQTPVSFVVTEGKDKYYFNVLGKTFINENGSVSETTCNNAQFNRVNSLLNSFKKVNESLVYTHKYNPTVENIFTVSEGSIKFERNNISEEFDSVSKFNEFVNTLSTTMPTAEKIDFMNVCGAVAEVAEAYDNIVAVDTCKVMECSNGTVCAIMEGTDNVNLTVFRSYQYGTSSTNYEYMVEALKQVTSMTGIDLKFMYEARIDEDCKKQDPEEYANIKQELKESKQAKIELRKQKIAQLAEKYKNDPARIALLNRTANELALLENLN